MSHRGPPTSGVRLPGKADVPAAIEELAGGSVKPRLQRGTAFARSLLSTRGDSVYLLIKTFQYEPHHLTQGTLIAYMEGLPKRIRRFRTFEVFHLRLSKVDVSPGIFPNMSRELLHLLSKYANCFATNVSKTSVARVRILAHKRRFRTVNVRAVFRGKKKLS